ncbi:endo alpha-1,4 polygalactosaminidase [Streptomyces sp. P1-3]|uniref:endo alpha-1,4 polygalactosaminidase n=1 Tax=Streptomyces sp. P1-3 TaxID=3421658 RepID=UPI003D365F72
MAKQGKSLGFDLAAAEECGQYDECGQYAAAFDDRVFVIEYEAAGLAPVRPPRRAMARRLHVHQPPGRSHRQGDILRAVLPHSRPTQGAATAARHPG